MLFRSGCSYRELKKYDQALEAFQEARVLFKGLKEVIHVARCDQNIAHCLTEKGDAEGALRAAQKALDVFETAHDHRRENFALFELAKAHVLNDQLDEGLQEMEKVLDIVAESEPKDFEFIMEIERKLSVVLKNLGKNEESEEIERRLNSVSDVIKED